MESICLHYIPVQADVARGLFRKKNKKEEAEVEEEENNNNNNYNNNIILKYIKKIRAQISIKTAIISDLK